MSECQSRSISIAPQLGQQAAEWLAFGKKVSRVFQSCDQSSAPILELRTEACAYLDRPTIGQLKLMFASNVLLDFACHGWRISNIGSKTYLHPPSDQGDSPTAQKDRIRKRHLIERDAQLREPAVQEFIKSMERRRLTTKGWHSIFSVIRDGEELATSLQRATTYIDPDGRARQLAGIIDPYFQFVTPEAVCHETGLRLIDIWRYFRHTWVNSYRSVPGRNLMILVRDRATPYHPVVGIAALASSVIQQSIRDKWIGWDSETTISSLSTNPSRRKISSLLKQLRGFGKGIYIHDLVRDGLLAPRDLRKPSPEVIKALRSEAAKRIKMHQKNPETAAHKSGKARTTADWISLAETNLYRSKRCKQLAAILEIQQILTDVKLASCSSRQLKEILQRSAVKRALSRIVRFGKAERVGIRMMDIMVCGAIAPYNAILGGKLICLLLCSPAVVQAYRRRYGDHVSVIASGMKGRKVKRDPGLVLLCTTSLYGNGSSQYNRVKLPTDVAGGLQGNVLKYQELGTSEGFGSFHFSKETLRIADAMLGRFKQGRKVNSIFGEGVNPLMRKMREALAFVGLPGDLLLNHGNRRIIYGIPLAKNFREVLLGFDKRAMYFVPQNKPQLRTSLIAAYWMQRWLSRRIADSSVLEQVSRHSLAYPIRHGAKVELPGLDAAEKVKSMIALVGAG